MVDCGRTLGIGRKVGSKVTKIVEFVHKSYNICTRNLKKIVF